MSPYRGLIREFTGCSEEDAAMIEEIMRCDIFHSTLDWQTEEQLRRAARQAKAILDENRELLEDHRRQLRDAVAHMKAEQAHINIAR